MELLPQWQPHDPIQSPTGRTLKPEAIHTALFDHLIGAVPFAC
jgi:hypothetical protein